MGIDTTRDQVAYGMSQPLIGVPLKPIVSDRNPTGNDKAQLGQLWINPTVNTAYILVSVTNNVAIWGTYATPIPGNLVVGGTITAGLGLTVLAGGINITGNSTFNNDVTITGTLNMPSDIHCNALYANDIQTTTNPAIALDLNENGIYAAGTDVNVDVSVTTKGNGDFVLDCLFGSPLAAQWRTGQDWIQTLDGVRTILLTIPLAVEQMVTVKSTINAFKSTYDHALGGDIMISAYRPTAGNVTEIGNKVVSSYVDGGATPGVVVDADVDIPTQSVNIYVTGAIGETWNWVTTTSYMYTTHP